MPSTRGITREDGIVSHAVIDHVSRLSGEFTDVSVGQVLRNRDAELDGHDTHFFREGG